jgi:hypothetical protein
VAGAISEVLVDDNQLLKKGDPIARLDPRDYEMALAQAGANLSEKFHANASMDPEKARHWCPSKNCPSGVSDPYCFPRSAPRPGHFGRLNRRKDSKYGRYPCP